MPIISGSAWTLLVYFDSISRMNFIIFEVADNFVLLVPDADWLVQIKLEAYRIKENSQ